MLFVLTVFSVALGIASVLSIRIINRSAMAAFRGAVEAVSGGADLSVLPRVAALPESLYAVALAVPGVRAAYPVYQVTAAVDGRTLYYLDVVGADLFAPIEGPWSGWVEPGSEPGDVLSVPGWAAVSPALAAELGVARGGHIAVSSGTRRAMLTVGAVVDFQRALPLASRKLVVMDIAQVQHLLGNRGELTQIDVLVAEGVQKEDVATALGAAMGAAAEVLTPAQRAQRAEGLTAAFRLNLSALSLISLVVGFFLVHTATRASLVRRRTEFGILRATGATRGQVLGLIVADAALHGLLGVAIGLPLGRMAAQANLDVVSATISNLYLLSEIERLDIPPYLSLLAAGLGMAAALAGALGPALDLARTETRDLLSPVTLHEHAGARAGAMAASGGALLAGSWAWYLLFGGGWRPAGFVLAVALLIAIPLLVPGLLRLAAGRLRPRGFGPSFALRSLASRLQTTSFAIASLATAVAMLVGVTIMIGSFRSTVTLWIGNTLQADVYITARSWRGAGGQGTLDDSLTAALAAFPGVRAIDRLRGFLGYAGERRISIAGVDMALENGAARFPLQEGEPGEAFRLVRERGEVFITEPLARKTGLGMGDSIGLATPAGERLFRVAGVSYDYASENGGVAMDLGTYAAVYGDGALNSVALYLEAGTGADETAEAIRAVFADAPIQVRSNRSLRTEVLRIFDQTFAVTRLLQVMSLLVAAAGITLTLLIVARERRAELALYRALGADRRQVFGFFVGKGLGMGAGGLLLGAVTGGALAAILIYVINRAWFGWTIQVAIPWGQLSFAGATILLAAAGASIYPAIRASGAPAGDLSRDDL